MEARQGIDLRRRIILYPLWLGMLGLRRHRLMLLGYSVKLLSLRRIGPMQRRGLRRRIIVIVGFLWRRWLLLLRRWCGLGIVIYSWGAARDIHLLLLLMVLLLRRLGTHGTWRLGRCGRRVSTRMVRRQHLLRLL